MATTLEVAQDQIYTQFRDVWVADTPALIGGSPLVPASIQYEDTTNWTGRPVGDDDDGSPWCRINIRHATGEQATLADGNGGSLFKQEGTVIVQVFADYRSNKGSTLAVKLAMVAKKAFESKRTPDVWFRRARYQSTFPQTLNGTREGKPMATALKISSNITGLRFAEEESIGVLPTSPVPVWYPLEPNSYDDFGGELTRVARNPINPSRQRKKGNIVDLDSSGGFESDLTQENMQNILQGFFFANLRKKAEKSVATISGSPSAYQVTAGTDFEVGDLIFGKGFASSLNNGLGVVTAAASGSVTRSGLVAAATQTGIVSRVGVEFTSGDAQIDVSNPLPRLTTAAKDCTEIGLIPGEFVWIGGDAVGNQFGQSANNGWARVKSVAAGYIEFDKASSTMVTDTGTGKTIRLFCGRVLKNETGTDIVRRTYQLERTLGASDTTQPTQIQSEYVVGAVPSEFEFTINTADKATVSMSFMGTDHEQRSGVTGVKAGTRPAIVESDLFNTSSDVKRTKLAVVSNVDEAPTPLFGYITELSLTINNNLEPNKAVGVLGSFDVTEGTFQIDASMTAYFSDIAAVQSVRNNADVTLDFHMVQGNAGISIDIPMIGLGDARASIEQDQAITLPLTAEAGTGAKYDANMDHTLLMVFYDYLPDLADA
jgi:hypothetical protein